MTTRRGFLASMAALVAAPFVPKAEGVFARISRTTYPKLHANVWGTGGPFLTEERFARGLGMPWPPGSPEWREVYDYYEGDQWPPK